MGKKLEQKKQEILASAAKTGPARMEEIRCKIQRGGQVMTAVCKVIQIFLRISIIVYAIIMIGVFFAPKTFEVIRNLYEDNSFFHFLRDFKLLEGMPEAFQAAIGCFIAILMNAVLLLLVSVARKMIGHLAEGGRPFNVEGAKHMRRTAWMMLLMMLYNVLLGLISFAIVLMFSYLMEYGGYLQEQADETNRIQEEMIVSFAEITENKSGQTGQHIRRVSEYTRILARQLGLPPEQVENLRIASTMHDVGKLMIPSEILEKPGKLTDEEYATIKTHTTYGGELLKNVEGEEMALSRTIALQHHERVDGKGYPQQLSGDQISLEGRIVAVADVYDALTSRRSYKNAWKEEDAYQEILRVRGTQFDEKVVDAFIAAHDEIVQVQKRFADPAGA